MPNEYAKGLELEFDDKDGVWLWPPKTVGNFKLFKSSRDAYEAILRALYESDEYDASGHASAKLAERAGIHTTQSNFNHKIRALMELGLVRGDKPSPAARKYTRFALDIPKKQFPKNLRPARVRKPREEPNGTAEAVVEQTDAPVDPQAVVSADNFEQFTMADLMVLLSAIALEVESRTAAGNVTDDAEFEQLNSAFELQKRRADTAIELKDRLQAENEALTKKLSAARGQIDRLNEEAVSKDRNIETMLKLVEELQQGSGVSDRVRSLLRRLGT